MTTRGINPDLKQQSGADGTSVDVNALVEGVRTRDRLVLGRAITLIESTRSEHQRIAQEVLNQLLSETGNSVRVAITGVPGVGKSTFIEALGTRLTGQGHRLAVLTVDPTSERTGGSILGDKTRMERLANDKNAFIRPSPASGTLGGVARTTRESMLLCEAAGYDIVFVETVGVGQSETTVHSMVDFFLVLALAGAGDELQGIKRGIIEMADAIAINKADGDNKQAAEQARQAYEQALHLFPTPASGWKPPVLTCSAFTGEGIDDVWETVRSYYDNVKGNSFFEKRRREQARYWMRQTIEHHLKYDFFSNAAVRRALPEIEEAVLRGDLSSSAAAERLLACYRWSNSSASESQDDTA